VTLVDPRGELVQRLRLHEAAVGRSVRSYDLARLAGRRVTTVRAAAVAIDAGASTVRVRGDAGPRDLRFDQLVVAIGSGIDTAGVPGVADHAHTLTGPDAAARLAVALRHLPDAATVAVVGAGLTGIETAAEIAGARPGLRVRLLGPGAFGGWLSARGRDELVARLGRLGVELREHARVTAVEPGAVTLADGRRTAGDVVVWCAGFAAHPLLAESDLATDPAGRLLVDGALRSLSHPDVLGAGDAAAVPALPGGGAFRMSCQAGLPSGAHAGDTAAARARGRSVAPFDLGYLAWSISLGRRDAVVQWVDRADRPTARVSAGRPAVAMKELATRGTVAGLQLERRVPGSLRWLSGGRAVAAAPQVATA
jgi:NADH dehydrogenase FAD-containing subunit